MGIIAGKYRTGWIVFAWILAIILAATLDRLIAGQAHALGTDGFLKSHRVLREILKLPGWYPFTILVAIPVALFHVKKWRAAIFLLIATATASLNEVSKWVAGRARPFKTISGDSQVLTPFEFHPFPGFDAKNLCFPSGHAALAFATAAALGILWPRWRGSFFVLATCVAAERVMENAHWFSDTVAAAALGIGGVWIVRRILWDSITRTRRNDSNGRTLPLAGDPGV